ncbi:MAG: hypothetical protein IKZ87_03830 [Actinomycetaceae bacterium]|nr:hypothetical protein [Actinomycetaceae bacterium]
MLNHVLYYVGVSALVLVGVIIAGSAFVSIFASIRNSKAELAEQSTQDSNSPTDVGTEEVEEQ